MSYDLAKRPRCVGGAESASQPTQRKPPGYSEISKFPSAYTLGVLAAGYNAHILAGVQHLCDLGLFWGLKISLKLFCSPQAQLNGKKRATITHYTVFILNTRY